MASLSVLKPTFVALDVFFGEPLMDLKVCAKEKHLQDISRTLDILLLPTRKSPVTLDDESNFSATKEVP